MLSLNSLRQDAAKDSMGNNADADDDNDGVPDIPMHSQRTLLSTDTDLMARAIISMPTMTVMVSTTRSLRPTGW